MEADLGKQHCGQHMASAKAETGKNLEHNVHTLTR